MTHATNKKSPPTKKQRSLNAGISGTLIGAAGGAVIGSSFEATFLGLFLGALFLGLGEAVTDWRRKPGQQKPLAYRIVVAAAGGAVLGALWGGFLPDMWPLILSGLIGFSIGLFSLQRQRILLGTFCGIVVGLVPSEVYPYINPAVLGFVIMLLYRLLGVPLFRDHEPVSLLAEKVPAAEIPFVVPFVAHSGHIGPDYFRDLAESSAGRFERNAPDAGIVENMESLRGPTFDPDLVDPLIREFYEHTTRFKLAIVPVWKLWMKPFFWLYKQTIAQPIGQANLPFNQEEAQRGVVSYIDTIDFESSEIIDIRGWVRAFEATGEAIYVGIYTTFRHEERGYVSVGFPLPESNFTATLLPYNKDGSHFILKSRDTGLAFPGHYVSFNEEGDLTVLALPTFNEEIEVFLEKGELKTNHRFYLGRQNFLTLKYTIERMTGENAALSR